MKKNFKIITEKNLPKKVNVEDIKDKIIFGDALSTMKRIPENSIKLIITSPSYEVGKEYENHSSFEEYLTFQKEIIKEAKRILTKDGAIYWNVAQTPKDGEMLPLGAIFYHIFKENNFYLKNWIIWRFDGGLNCKKRLSGRYENILWFVKDKNNFIFNLDNIRIPSKWKDDKRNNPKGKNPTDFWEFSPEDSLWEINRVVNVSKEKTKHPCQFPEKLVERVIKASSNRGDIVLDMFNGSGTACKVANELNRHFIGIDKELKYCKIALNRVKNNLTYNGLSNNNNR